MNRQYIFQIEKLTKRHGQKEVLKDIWLSFYPGAKIGVLGSNGAGKSTLLRIMAGIDKNFDGTARLSNGFTVGYLSQEPQLDAQKNVQGNVEQAVAPKRKILDRFNEISGLLGEVTDDKEMQKLCDEMAKLQDIIDAQNLWELDRQVEMSMDVMNLPPGDADVTKLSGGERRRVALCKLLLEQPDLLLLDEPTNHLDIGAIRFLEGEIAARSLTALIVTHDRSFLSATCNEVLELSRTEVHRHRGDYEAFLASKQARLEAEGAATAAARNKLKTELAWVRDGQ
jgi:ATPase subunit of ABC transporter with duplicated ATPase domains